MRRPMIKFGLVPDPGPQTLQLSAAGELPDAREHWVTWTSTWVSIVKTLIGVGTAAAVLIGSHTLTSSRIAVLEEAQRTIVKRADLQAEQNKLLAASVIPRDQYYTDKAQQNAVNLQLAANQQQILLLLARGQKGN